MSLSVTEYRVECDVVGCENASVGTLSSLIVRGYSCRLLFDGKPVLYPLSHSNAQALNQPCICQSCREDKSYLRMEKVQDESPSPGYSAIGEADSMICCPECAGQGNCKPDGLTIKPSPKCKGQKMIPANAEDLSRSTSI